MNKTALTHAWRNLYALIALGAVALWVVVIASDRLDRWLFPSPRPYTDVVVDQAETRVAADGRRQLVATYTKSEEDCVLESFVVYGVYPTGVRRALEFEAARGPGETRHRAPGFQTMRLLVDGLGLPFSDVEVTTQHWCDGRLVALVMLRTPWPMR